MRPQFDGLPGPLGKQAAGGQPAHRLLQSVVITLLPGPGVLRAQGGGEGLQDRADHGGAVRGQVTGEDPGAGEGGLDPDPPVLEPGLRVILAFGQGPGVNLRGEPSQVFLPGPGPGRGDQDLIGGGPDSAGSLPVHRQMIRATDSDTTVPLARAARIWG